MSFGHPLLNTVRVKKFTATGLFSIIPSTESQTLRRQGDADPRRDSQP